MAGKIVFYQRIIESMNEGVMSLDTKGMVTMFNDPAGLILGMAPRDVLDKPFGQVFMMDMEENDQFCQVILDAVYDAAVGQTSTLDFVRPDGEKRVLSLSTSYLKSEDAQQGESAGVVVVISDITEITRSREKEKELNLKLRDAFIETEETNKQLESALKKVQGIRLFITFAVILGFVGVGYFIWQKDVLPSSMFSNQNIADSSDTGEIPYVEVTARPLTSSISLAGFVAPLEEINVVAPFDGKIKERFFVYDQKVEKGAKLLAMDTTQLEVKFREAKSSYIKAQQNFNELKNWTKSSDVSSARRSFTKAKNSLDASKRKLEESKVLFEKGIISKSEHESAQADYVNQQMDFTAAQESMDAVMDKANKENMDIARMELANAQVNLEDVEANLDQTIVYAPVAGIIIMPTGGDEGGAGGKSKRVESGVSVTQGEILVSVGNLDGLSVKAKVDEIDIGKIGFEMKVNVSGDAFSDIPMTGRVRQISSNAVSSGMDGPMFDVGIAIDSLTPDQKNRIRLGMSTNLEIMVYDNPSALMLPLSMVEVRGNEKFVKILAENNEVYEVPVVTGMTTLDSVEIRSGLKEGDRVVSGPASGGGDMALPGQDPGESMPMPDDPGGSDAPEAPVDFSMGG